MVNIYPQMPDLTCSGEPVIGPASNDAAFGNWVLDVRDAYLDCAAKLGAIRALVATWPTP